MKVGELINNSAKFLNIFEAVDRVNKIRKEGLPAGLTTGWAGFDKHFKFPPMGNLNVVTGTPGSGKSEWLDSLAINCVKNHDWKIFMYSPENYPAEYHLQKLAEKYIEKPMFGWRMEHGRIEDKDLADFTTMLTNNFTFVDCHINNASVDEILNGIFLECRSKKVDMAVIDPWNKLESQKPKGISNTDFIGQCLTRIQMFSRQHNISFWVVAHPSKPMRLKNGAVSQVGLYDISDSAHWYNMVDNGFIVNRTWTDKTGGSNISTIKIAKIKDRRYGKCGEHQMEFIPAIGHFQEIGEK